MILWGSDVQSAGDDDRLIQEVLAELGWEADPKSVADRVRRLNFGLPAEDEFIAICSWRGKARLVHKLDQHQAPLASRDAYQVPDLLAQFENAGPLLIEGGCQSTRRVCGRIFRDRSKAQTGAWGNEVF